MAGLYIHVPFCHAKCWYCDFYSVAGSNRASRYIAALEREWGLRRDELNGAEIETIYFGGGTPSILTADLIQALAKWLPLGPSVKEVTIEVNPEDVTTDKIEAWRAYAGVNRVSMGVQSLSDVELKNVGRRHSASDAIKAVETLRATGIDNISLDLIYGLPGQTLESWEKSLDGIIDLRPDHLSAYMLSYEPGTRLDTRRRLGKVVETDEETILEMYRLLCDKTRAAGFEHYEISNFAIPGRRSRHNSAYWTGTPYLGLGPGAHSFDGKARRYNPGNLKAWCDALESGVKATVTESESLADRTNDTIMVRLRTARGLDINDIPEIYRADIINAARALGDERLRFDTATGRFVIPEQGWMVSDDTIASLFV